MNSFPSFFSLSLFLVSVSLAIVFELLEISIVICENDATRAGAFTFSFFQWFSVNYGVHIILVLGYLLPDSRELK